jgi:hypothetical protein
MFGHWCTYPTLKIAPNPPPGIKLGIKVDNHGYQKKSNQMLDFDI